MLKSPSVLVCEDDFFLRDLLTGFLRSEGFLTYEAENGFDSLHVMIDSPPDVILLDMEMPRMNGFTFLEKLKAAGFKTPVYVLTGLHQDNLLSELKQYGVKDVIQKPYSLKRISGLLNSLKVNH